MTSSPTHGCPVSRRRNLSTARAVSSCWSSEGAENALESTITALEHLKKMLKSCVCATSGQRRISVSSTSTAAAHHASAVKSAKHISKGRGDRDPIAYEVLPLRRGGHFVGARGNEEQIRVARGSIISGRTETLDEYCSCRTRVAAG